MGKYMTRDNKKISIKIDPDNEQAAAMLTDIVPRLSYDEILDGELEKRLQGFNIESVKISSLDDTKTLIFSLAMFNAISKAPGL